MRSHSLPPPPQVRAAPGFGEPNERRDSGTLSVFANGVVNGFPLQPGTYQGQIDYPSPRLFESGHRTCVADHIEYHHHRRQSYRLTPVTFQIGGANPPAQTINVALATGGAAGFTAAASTSSGGSWLSVSPAAGATPGNIVVSVNPAGLDAWRLSRDS